MRAAVGDGEAELLRQGARGSGSSIAVNLHMWTDACFYSGWKAAPDLLAPVQHVLARLLLLLQVLLPGCSSQLPLPLQNGICAAWLRPPSLPPPEDLLSAEVGRVDLLSTRRLAHDVVTVAEP